MAQFSNIYDLVLLLSSAVEDSERARILSEVESEISSASGSIERRDDWGNRPLTFRIDHQQEAHYHLFQFSGPKPLLETLSHNLRIADGVLRFRIIKVLTGTPPAPDSAPPVIAAVAHGGSPAAGSNGDAEH
jgi:small subunit ribosomal protein S6